MFFLVRRDWDHWEVGVQLANSTRSVWSTKMDCSVEVPDSAVNDSTTTFAIYPGGQVAMRAAGSPDGRGPDSVRLHRGLRTIT